MGGKLTILLLLAIFFFFTTSTASRDITALPHFNRSFTVKANQTASYKCSYTVDISTSCSSVRYTRDQISLSFGDAYGTQVYAPRIDDPDSNTFERCSKDTFKISGPCMDDVCYLYLYRAGSDGWKPQSLTVYISSHKFVTFIYNTFLPSGVWYGFDHCNAVSTSAVA